MKPFNGPTSFDGNRTNHDHIANAGLAEREKMDDCEALTLLATNFRNDRGHFTPKVAGYVPTEAEWTALHYLFCEWDYSYDVGCQP